ncbi:DUF5703 domain-containing protein [Mucilaginibacter sp. RS28]|uniref:DUF5703 domain-containing protein n=1 Tax=Mucilaginibacter straminoryzae TaxID=2932774 RepID=A0A9X1X2T7_9SPHI|nr:DUF5703 domain-containing protein [Mucilaginibacter straminoryzae]MCJ8208945.1 DUF5703 domain-containing protein [Mucilaginibacter straminoryzae]
MKYHLLLFLFILPVAVNFAKAQDISQYNVAWTTQSKNSSESMPLGGGDIGCNVWVENNDIIFYIGRSGTFDENSSMLKLGRVRLNLSPNPFKSSFRQELKLKEGYIEITGDHQTKVKLWVEVFQPVIHVSINSADQLTAKVTYENWRTEDHSLSTEERHQAYGYSNTTPDKLTVITRKDTIRPQSSSLVWYHQNRNSEMIIDREAIQQHLGDAKAQLWNPMKDLIFGGELLAPGMKFTGNLDSIYVANKYRGWVYQSVKPANKLQFSVVLHTAHASPTGWMQGLQKAVNSSAATDAKWQKNLQWWQQYWNRGYIYINTDKKDQSDKGWEVGRNYNVFRYQLACNAYGEWPTKFNGGLFVFDADFVKGEYKNKVTPDFRRWGGGNFTAQNQRLVYWPMLKSGDFDMMKPQFEFYNRALDNATLRTKKYWGHSGASLTEQVENFGLPAGHTYERLWGKDPHSPRSDSSSTRTLVNQKGETMKFIDYGFLTNQWVVDHYDGQLEFSKMILDYQQYTGADISKYLPFIDASVRFFDEHYQYWSKKLNGYPLDANGKLILYPGAALETYKGATNAVSTVAGLKTVLNELLELPSKQATIQQRTYWKALLNRIPTITTRELNGHTVIAPAEKWDGKVINSELPQLYPVFPYHIYGVGKPDLQLAIDTWHFGADKKNQYSIISWHPDPIYAADLGLTEEAKDLTTQKLSNATYRFPTFWGPGLDWAPDHNWGGSGMIALQEMMLQTDGKKTYLMPAWPKDWNAIVKLHAPYNTTVEATIKNGKVEKLKVTPQTRTKDVMVMQQ